MSATIAETPEMLTTVDGKPLKQAMQTAQRRARIRAFLLVFPLLAFVVVTFIFPILQMLHNSMHNPGFIIHRDIETKVETLIMINLQQWFKDNPAGTPVGEDAYAALVEDLRRKCVLRVRSAHVLIMNSPEHARCSPRPRGKPQAEAAFQGRDARL